MHPPKTYFEQIPVETVQKIATEFPQDIAKGDDTPEAQTPDKVTPCGDDWRELAQKVQEETDNTKMMGMVEELIVKLDEMDRTKRLLKRDNQGGSNSSET